MHTITLHELFLRSANADAGKLDSIGHLISLEAPNNQVQLVFEISSLLETT